MTMTERELLRLHIEAVWGVGIPPLDSDIIELTAVIPLPPWLLYHAHLSQGQITIWRPGIAPEQRADLLQRAYRAGTAYDAAIGMRREVVLWFLDSPHLPDTQPQHTARLLTADDATLLEAFEAGSASYFLSSSCAPCIGVIVDGQLVSVAHSSRRTAQACELGINTAPDARHRGYATIAVRAWTQAIQQEGLTPIYSAFAHNTASLRLAAATGYVRVSESVYGPVGEAHA